MEKLKEFLNVYDGYGDGYGYSYSYGSGSGYGDGSGYGSGYGDGYGYGYGDGLKSINKVLLHNIDGIQTAILHIHNNIAKGFMVNDDLSISPCYVVKQNNLFAHGKTIKDAQDALMDKLFEDMPEEERINSFFDNFNLTDKYPAMDFFNWHNKLTGSCLFGRQQFVKEKGIDLDNDMLTVTEFIALTESSYGNVVIKKLKKEKKHD